MPGSVQVGDWIAGRFEVFEIQHGGMGVVFFARDAASTSESPFVAIKTLRPEILADRDRCRRFETECQLWTKLGRHPNIVRAHELMVVEDRPQIVLELVRGGDLSRKIGVAPIELPRALRLGLEFCLGMEHAIRQGLRCHRDIKPGNLLLDEHGSLKITDFGLASIRDELLAEGLDGTDDPIPLAEVVESQPILWTDPRDARQPPPPTSSRPIAPADAARPPSTEAVSEPDLEATADYRPELPAGGTTYVSRLTRSGAMLGTLPYMAPEQFRDAHHVDVRADIYSFGVVLFEMLTGRRPFLGKTIGVISRQHALYEPPSVVPAIPRRHARIATAVDRLIRRCLAKVPDERFSTIYDLHEAIAALARGLK